MNIQICISDVKNVIALLDRGAAIIDKNCHKPCEQDKARLMRKLSKKLKKKLDYGNAQLV